MKRLISLLIIGLAAISAYSMAAKTPAVSKKEDITCSSKNACSRINKSCNAKSIVPAQGEMAVTSNAKKPSADIHWQEYSPSTLEQAKNSHRLVILFGKSDVCHWSQQMETTTFNDPDIIKLINGHYVPVFFDFYKHVEVGAHYQILNLPVIIMIDQNGNTVKVFSGYMTKDELKSNLHEIIQVSNVNKKH